MMREYLTIAEIAKQADIPNSTCRRYLSTFNEFFVAKGGNRLKKYEQGAVEILIRIKNLYEEGLESNQIHNVLINEFSLVVDGDEQRETSEMPTVPALATNEDILELKELFKQQQEFNKLLLEEYKKQGEQITQLFEIISQDKKQLEQNKEQLEQIINDSKQAEIEVATTEQEEKKGFFARLFGK